MSYSFKNNAEKIVLIQIDAIKGCVTVEKPARIDWAVRTTKTDGIWYSRGNFCHL